MPTGYTSIIDDSEGKATFQQFAWRCARAFGAVLRSLEAKGKLHRLGYNQSNRTECHGRPIITYEEKQ